MTKALSTKTAAQHELETLEQEINTEAFEAFYHIGQKLLRIKRDRMYESAGFKSWAAYCASGRIDYKLSQADTRIRCSELRPELPALPGGMDWNVRSVEELCKCKTDKDAKRVARKAISEAKKTGSRVTAKLIAQIRDGDEETGREKKRQENYTLASHLAKLADILVEWRTSLEKIDDLATWEDVPRVTMTRVITEANALLKFLRS
jgi:hypothetical protein